MRQTFTVVLLLLLSGALHAAKDPDVVGVYTVTGVSGGGTYRGHTQVTKHDARYELRWQDARRGEQIGVGVIDDGKLVVSWGSDTALAVAVYRVKAGNPLTLEGRWATTDAPGVHAETLIKTDLATIPKRQLQPVRLTPLATLRKVKEGIRR